MKDSKKVQYNLFMGTLGQIIAILFGIIVPRIILVNYGSEVNGLLSSITNIFAYIAIVEAGIMAASRQALYKTLSEKNQGDTNAVLSACNRYYKKTGIIYLGLVLIFSIVYPLLIHTEIPYGTITLLILLNGIGNVLTYFFHGKYQILLIADGKEYVSSAMGMLGTIVKQGLKIILISAGMDVVFVQVAALIASFVQMSSTMAYIRKNYPWIDLTVEPNLATISQSKYVLVNEINYLITFNVDTAVLTLFTPLSVVSVYALYNMLYGIISRALSVIKSAFEFKIAHTFFADRSRFLRLFEAYETCYITLAFALLTTANFFMLPFIRLYTAGVNDANYIDAYLPYAFTLVHLLAAGRYPSDVMVNISGHFKQTMKSAIVESTMNVVLSLILVQKYGILGVLIGSIISSLYRGNYLIVYINKQVIDRDCIKTYKCWIVNFIVFLAIAYLNQYIVVSMGTYTKLIAVCIPYTICVFILYFGSAFLFAPDAARYVLQIIKPYLSRKKA